MPTPNTVYQGSAGLASNASASSAYSSNTYFAPEAWDGISGSGDNNNGWMSSSDNGPHTNGSCWWQVDLTETKANICAVRLCRRASAGSTNFPKDIKMLVSTTGAFAGEQVSLGTAQINNAADNAWSEWIYPGGVASGRYVRIEVHTMWLSGSAQPWVTFQEAEIGAGAAPLPTERILTLDNKALRIAEGRMPGRLTGEVLKGLTQAEIYTLLAATATPTADKLTKYGSSGQLNAAYFSAAGAGGKFKLHQFTLAASATTTITLSGTSGRALLWILGSNANTSYAFFHASNGTIVQFQAGSVVSLGTSGSDPGTASAVSVWANPATTLNFNNRMGSSQPLCILEMTV